MIVQGQIGKPEREADEWGGGGGKEQVKWDFPNKRN